jgi:hypothetical protein
MAYVCERHGLETTFFLSLTIISITSGDTMKPIYVVFYHPTSFAPGLMNLLRDALTDCSSSHAKTNLVLFSVHGNMTERS